MLSTALCALTLAVAQASPAQTQLWQAHLDVSEAGEPASADLRFGLDLVPTPSGWKAFLVNEPERIQVPSVEWDGTDLRLSIDHYDSRIEAQLDEAGVLRGTWQKLRGKDKLASVPFWATLGRPERKLERAVLPRQVAGRWAVDFADDALGSVGIFEQKGAFVSGTFLTATGDYRYLAGEIEGKRLTLSCFDGAHAFFFDAALGEDDTLSGTFHSGNWWLDSWTAKRDDQVQMTDGFAQTTWDENTSLAELNFLDEAGALRSLAEPGFLGRATIVQLFGTWCPNCHDETRYLVELQQRYAARGLRVIGLAFELSGGFERDSKQLGVFRKRHEVPYPLLLAGTANKAEATLAFPAIDRLRSFPTTIFFDASGRVRGLHSGFAGPATGDEHLALRKHYEAWIEALLSEEPAPLGGALARLDGSIWQQPGGGLRAEFTVDANGQLQASHTPMDALGVPDTDPKARVSSAVQLIGDALWFGGQSWRLDELVGSLGQTRQVGLRMFELGAPARAIVRELDGVAEIELVSILGDRGSRPEELALRREALFILAAYPFPKSSTQSAMLGSLSDASHQVRLVALWAAGEAKLFAARPALIQHLSHPNAAERREAVAALIKLSAIPGEINSKWPDLGSMGDPLIREMLKPFAASMR